MSVILEVNVVSFPDDKPHMCRKDEDEELKWTEERKRKVFLSESKVHMIKLGPVTEEFLTRKKLGWSKVDFGIDFKLTDEGDYKWTSGKGALHENGLPIHHVYKLKDALKSIGYVEDEYCRNGERKTETPVEKIIFILYKKF